jgi:hypothetical protein
MRCQPLAVLVLVLATMACGGSDTATPGSTDAPAGSTPHVTVADAPALADAVAQPELRLGDEGEWVATLQRQLTHHGVPVEDDGTFGPDTEAAVRDFQSTHGLIVDGVAGSSTWTALGDDPVVPSSTDAAEPSPSTGIPLREIIEPYELDLLAGTNYTSYRLDCSLLTGEQASDYRGWERVDVDRDHIVDRDTVLRCGGRTEPAADVGDWYVLVLDDHGTTTRWEIGTGGADLPYAEHGLLCREYMATEDFERAIEHMGGSAPWNDDTLAYKWALAYWFLEGSPDRMDVDRNGLPCELLFDADVVAEVWGTSFPGAAHSP